MWGTPVGVGLRSSAGGDSLVAHRGVVGLGTRYVRRIPGRRDRQHTDRRRGRAASDRTRSRPDARQWSVVQRPPAGTIPDAPGSYQFKDADGRVIYVGKAKSLRSRLSNYFQDPGDAAAPHRADGGRPPRRSSGSRSRNEVEALFLEFNLIKQHRPRFNIRLKDDKSYPFLAVTLDEEWPRAMVMRGAQAQGRPLLRPVRATPTPSARRSTSCCARSRSARARTTSSTATSGSAGRACYAHIEKCVGAVRRRRSTTTTYDELVARAARLPRRRHRRRSSSGSSTQMHEARRRARVRAGGAPARPAHRRCARPSSASRWSATSEEDLDVIGLADDDARGGGAGVLRAQGPGRRPQGLRRRQGRGPRAPGSSSAASLEQLYDDAAARRRPEARSSCPSSPTTSTLYEEFLGAAARGARCAIRVPQRGDKRELLETVTLQRAGGVRPPQAAPGLRPQRRGPCAHRAAGRARAARGAAAHRVLRHLQPPGHRHRRLDGGDGGRPAEAVRLPALQDPGPSPATTTSRRWRRCSPAGSAATCSERDEGARSRQAVRLPAEPAAGRRRQGPARRRGAGARGARARGHLRRGLAKRFEEVYVPGRSRPGPHPARVRGAVPAPADPRRGPPLRDHVPPPAARTRR